MAVLLALPILSLLLIFQSAVVSKIPLLQGTADLVLLAIIAWALQKRVDTAWHWAVIAGIFVGVVSAIPFLAALVAYPLAVSLALFLRQRVWKVPMLAMFVATFFGTLMTHSVFILSLQLTGNPMPILEGLNLVTLPSTLLNILLAVPAFALMGEMAGWLYPEELEV